MNCALPITLPPVGVMHCRLLSLDDTPKNFSESDQAGTLEIFPRYAEALEGINGLTANKNPRFCTDTN